jgi:hypothetical protein
MYAKLPSTGAVLAGLVPFVGVCFSVPLWDRIDPMVFGLPFNLFWLLLWIPLTMLCLAIALRIENVRRRGGPQ